jgi:hypothetical protein
LLHIGQRHGAIHDRQGPLREEPAGDGAHWD